MPAWLLPYPPSVNALWRTVGGRPIKSAKYRAWLDEAGWAMRSQGRPPGYAVPVALQIGVGFPDNRRRDIDNVLKPTLDLLEATGVVDDDWRVRAIEVFVSDDVTNGLMVVVEPMETADASTRS